VIGNDEDKKGHPMRAIEFPRIKGGKAFDVSEKWFGQMLKEIGQPKGHKVEGKH
jgi:pyrophosphate--fructose-6-phosphate 1-phosphotransferase